METLGKVQIGFPFFCFLLCFIMIEHGLCHQRDLFHFLDFVEEEFPNDCKSHHVILCREILVNKEKVSSMGDLMHFPILGSTNYYKLQKVRDYKEDECTLVYDFKNYNISLPDLDCEITVKLDIELGSVKFIDGYLLDTAEDVYYDILYHGRSKKHFLLQVDVGLLPRESEAFIEQEDFDRNSLVDDANDIDTTTSMRTTGPATVSIAFYYTDKFLGITEDPQMYSEKAIRELNKVFHDSKIDVNFVMRCSAEMVSFREEMDFNVMFNRFANYKDSFEELRKGGDIAILLLSDSNVCGAAILNGFTSGKSFGIVQKACALSYYSFAHEVGHIFGAHHNREVGVSAQEPFAYGHLISNAEGNPAGTRTVMSYFSQGHSRRVGYFSNPDVSFEGSSTGVTDNNDNAKRLNLNRFKMQNIGKDNKKCD